MPTINPVTELQRNAAALIREAMQTKEPIYLTKNGSSAVVLLDAEEYDRQVSAYHELWKERVRLLYELGEAQQKAGMVYTFDEVVQMMRDKWGDDVF